MDYGTALADISAFSEYVEISVDTWSLSNVPDSVAAAIKKLEVYLMRKKYAPKNWLVGRNIFMLMVMLFLIAFVVYLFKFNNKAHGAVWN